MIQERNTNLVVQSTIEGDKIQMGIDAGAMAHIMNILTDLYSNPIYAILREYATNALDAMIEAGNLGTPIEVWLPSQLSPFLKIRDFGIGLSVNDLHEIYSQYGASTKRGTNDQVGMLGLGCKSALTYTNQFTVTSVKDGTKVQVSVSRDEDGTGSMTVVDTAQSTEPDGVEIMVPVKMPDLSRFKDEAARFFSFWEPGTVLVNGAEPPKLDGLEIVPGELILLDTEAINRGTDYIVMGNVPYPIANDRITNDLGWNQSVVAFVPIGAVNFTPSREALHYTAKTKQTILDVKKKWMDNVAGAVQREIDKCATPGEAVVAMTRWHRILRPRANYDYTFGKYGKIPAEFASKDGLPSYTLVNGNAYGTLSRHQKVKAIAVEAVANAVWVHGYDRPTFTAGQKKKLNKWAEDTRNGVTPGHYILTLDKPDTTWLDSDNLVDWSVIEAIKLDRALSSSANPGRIPGSYDLWRGENLEQGVPGNDVDDGNPVYFLRGNRWQGATWRQTLDTVLDGNYTLVCLPANRIEKFARLFPQAKRVENAVQELYDAWWAGVTDAQKLALACRASGDQDDLQRFDPAKVDDPDLKAAIQTAKVDVTKVQKAKDQFGRVLYHLEIKLPLWMNPLDKYPLLENCYNLRGADKLRHAYLYINAAYAADRKEG